MAVIGIDASRANTSHRTGTEWYIFNLIKQFQTIIPSEHEVILYTKEPLLDDLKELPSNWRNQVLRWPPGLLWTQLRMSLRMMRQAPDVLFIPAHTVPLVHPKQSVYVAHDLGFERIPELYENTHIGGKAMNAVIRLLTLGKYGTSELDYHRWSMQYAVRRAAKIITISQFTKQELQDIYPVPDHQVAVVYNGFSGDEYRYLPDATQPDEPYMLYVGRIEQKKNIPRLIQAWAVAREQYHIPHKLYLVGSEGYGYSEVEELIEQHKLQDVVVRPGYVPQEEMNKLMNQASAFVFPTRYEGFGIPVLEALAAGTTVACSDIPPLREVGGEACMYFDPEDVNAMAAQIAAVAKLSQAEQVRLRKKGFEQVQKFSWQKCTEETWQVLESVLP